MSYVSRHAALRPAPQYKLAEAASHRRRTETTTHEFSRRFRGSRPSRRDPHDAATPSRHRHRPAREPAARWPAVVAVMLVANLVAPTVLAAPSFSRRAIGHADPDTRASASALTIDTPIPPLDDVRIAPIQRSPIKTEYSFADVMRALSSATSPFRHLGKLIGDAYAVVTGNAMDRKTLDAMQSAGSFADAITSLIPAVQRARIPGHVAELTADVAEGKSPVAEQLMNLVTFGDPRTMGADVPIQNGAAVERPVLPVKSKLAPAPEQTPLDAGADTPARVIDSEEPAPPVPPEDDAVRAKPAPQDASPAQTDTHRASAPSLATAPRIEGEHEHLQGYAHELPAEPLPAGSDDRLVVVRGHHYLAGDAGYYRVTRDRRTGHWLIDAPGRTRAQVPVTYDAETGTWHAQPPLRLCGGGCGPSRESTPDSVAMSRNEVSDATRHIGDDRLREAILLAYGDLGHLHLMRTNREDLREHRDNSIVEHRRILTPQLMRLDPHSTLFEQQREAAEITAMHYDSYLDVSNYDLNPEAFCQENAEILFHYLLTRGVPGHRIRMITVRPQGRPPHVMVLYTESDPFIDLLDLSTPQPPVAGHVDGINGERFTAALFLTRDSTVLLDPWSRTKASSFRDADDIEALMGMLDVSLRDTGHRPAGPFTVSVTRPYPAPRDRAAEAVASLERLRSAASARGPGHPTNAEGQWGTPVR